jgi:prevent-host-death family protein
MKEVGIRELKARTSEIVRKVAESHVSYTVTCRGRPVGVLSPATLDAPHDVSRDDIHAWNQLDVLADRIGESRRKRKSVLRELTEMRR